VGDVQKEGFVGLLRLVEELQGEIRPQKCRVPVLAELRRVVRYRLAVEV
jgi:hypothetical protein